MNYIVWKVKYTSYDIDQGGYFVKYKDKLCDEFSVEWYDAKRYKSLGGAISRLGINIGNCRSEKDFIKRHKKVNKSAERDMTLSKILDEEIDISKIVSYRGKIEMVKDGKLIGDATDEIIQFIKNKIKSNYNKIQKKLSNAGITPESDYISVSKGSAEFWDDWSKK